MEMSRESGHSADSSPETAGQREKMATTGNPEAKSEQSKAAVAPPPPSGIHLWRWPVVIIIIIAAGLYVTQRLTDNVETVVTAPERTVKAAIATWRAFNQVQIDQHVIKFVSGIPVGRDDASLVVHTLDFTHTGVAENTKKRFGINFGTTTVFMSVPTRIHYAVDFSGAKPVEFHVDGETGSFIAIFPDPEIQAVELFSHDKKEMVKAGRFRLESRSGEHLKDQLEQNLYNEVREIGKNAAALRKVRDQARPVLAKFVTTYLYNRGEWDIAGGFLRVEVKFTGDAHAPERNDVTLP
jgi:hypothetical protein